MLLFVGGEFYLFKSMLERCWRFRFCLFKSNCLDDKIGIVLSCFFYNKKNSNEIEDDIVEKCFK